MPGPPPKRAAERRRTNTPTVPTLSVDLEAIGADAEPDSLPFLIAQPIVIPEPPIEDPDPTDPDAPDASKWHPMALQLYEAAKRSGQSLFYEPSDWAVLMIVCESLSRALKPQVVGIIQATESMPGEVIREIIPLKGSDLSSYLKAFGQLMVTEGERRRLSIELERTRQAAGGGRQGQGAKVIKITDRRQALLMAGSRRSS